MKKNIAIVDDHELVAKGVSQFFTDHPRFEVITILNDPLEALERIPILKPQIVLMDLDMPKLNGLELMEKVRARLPETHFVILTMHVDKNTVKKAMDLGAMGYVSKNADETEFIACVEKVAKGDKFYSQDAMQALLHNSSKIGKSNVAKLSALTPRETEILKHVAEGLSNKEIAEELFIAVRTVETHRKTVMEKLQVNKVAGLVRIAVQEGLI